MVALEVGSLNIKGENKGRARIGIIGCGHWGIRWIRIFEDGGAKVKVCCDVDKERLRMVADKHPNVNLFEDYRDILADDDLDAVYVATPPPTHFEIAKESLLANKHVLVEKPMTTEYERGLELVKIAKEMECVLMVGDTYIYNRAINTMKHLIGIGEIGSLRYIHSWMTNSIDMWPRRAIYNYTSVLWDLGPHQISILNYFVGRKPVAVSVTYPSPLQRGNVHKLYDTAIVNFRFPHEVTAMLYLNWLDYSRNRRIFVSGQEGVLDCEDISSRESTKICSRNFSLEGRLRINDAKVYEVDVSDTLKNECKQFLSCVMNRSHPITNGEEGVAVVKVLEATQRSISNCGRFESIA